MFHKPNSLQPHIITVFVAHGQAWGIWKSLYFSVLQRPSASIWLNPSPQLMLAQPKKTLFLHPGTLISTFLPHARTRVGTGCHPHGLLEYVSTLLPQILLWGPSQYVGRDREVRTWALDVADNAAGGVVHELNSDLSNTSTGTYKTVRNSSFKIAAQLCSLRLLDCAYRYGPKRG